MVESLPAGKGKFKVGSLPIGKDRQEVGTNFNLKLGFAGFRNLLARL